MVRRQMFIQSPAHLCSIMVAEYSEILLPKSMWATVSVLSDLSCSSVDFKIIASTLATWAGHGIWDSFYYLL